MTTWPVRPAARSAILNGKIDRIAYCKTEAAGMLGLCPRTIDNMIAEKQLLARKVGRRVVIPATALCGLMGASPKADHTVVRISYTTAEVAQVLGVSSRTIDHLVAAKELKARRVRGRVLIPTDSLHALLRSDHRTTRAAA